MRAAIAIFPGSNCDRDMIVAIKKITGKSPLRLWHKDTEAPNLDLIIIPGGFTFGDYLRCGALAARSPIINNIKNHISRGGALLGVCNGFQILIEANILPGSLVRNKKLLFTCRETTLEIQNSLQSPFLSSFNKGDCLNIPVAHNEGNYIANPELLKELENNGRIAFKYKKNSDNETNYNPNGSLNDIAGILSKNGRVLGMMPHPERSINALHGGTDGLKFLTKSIEQIVG
ncbi:phosphoribosylformylglycinamidine synthase subunit PurQ [Alphaproteobacteria bacterium]|nr:phosphoribosylformylglycinamidine synthase subunit PurQ [Alphaproteobacteria bacterium]